MAVRGRKPKPTAKKKLQGNPGKRALNKREPRPASTADAKPRLPHALGAGLDGVVVEKVCGAFNDQYLPQLQTIGVYTDADQAAFELMAMHYALAWTAAEVVQRDGLMILGVKGEKKHPLLQVVRENSMAFRAYAAEFGMTPSARSRLEVGGEEELDPLEEELFGTATRVMK